MNPELPPVLRATLAEVRQRLALADRRDPCWLIGSAAAAVAGVDGFTPADIDLLMSTRDAEAFASTHRDRMDATYVPGDAGRFRSRFARFRFAPMPVEIMGGLEVFRDGSWHAVRIESRLPCALLGDDPWLPSLEEQARLFECFGRDKDLARANLVRAMLPEGRIHAA